LRPSFALLLVFDLGNSFHLLFVLTKQNLFRAYS
jgi:hypothetical protein